MCGEQRGHRQAREMGQLGLRGLVLTLLPKWSAEALIGC